jgi:anti-sigma factor RsiW
MSTRQPHPENLGAYVLGALNEREARDVDGHLTFCADCRNELAAFAATRDALDEIPPEAFLDGPPEHGDLVLQRALRRVRSETSSTGTMRAFTLSAAAAVAVVAALGGGVLIGRGVEHPQALPSPTNSVIVPGPGVMLASGAQGAARINATITPAAGWVRVHVSVTGVPVGQRCRLVVVSRGGERLEAGSWLVSPQGATNGTTLDGAALVAADQVAAVQVQAFDGHTLVTAPV